jgi:prolycopene isomerase
MEVMHVHRSAPRQDTYDVIVVGSGIGGLSTSAYLARVGLSVLNVDQRDGPGGYAHAFTRGSYSFDPSVHFISQASEGLLLQAVLEFLGVRDQCEFVPIREIFTSNFPGLHLEAPCSPEALIESLQSVHPPSSNEIKEFVNLVRQVHLESHQLPPQVDLKDLDKVVARFPVLFKYTKATTAEVIVEKLSNARVRAACASTWPYNGSPPSRLSFMAFSQILSANLDGKSYCRGGFQIFADALATAITMHGGDLVLGRDVTRITVENGRAVGIQLDDGSEIRSRAVVSNADARETFERLIGFENLPDAFTKRVLRLRPGLSACVFFSITDLDLRQFEVTYEEFLYRHWDHEETYRDILDGKPGGMWFSIPTLLDPSMAGEGEHMLVLTAMAAWDIGRPWAEEKERYLDTVISHLNDLYPGFQEGLKLAELAAPPDLYRFTRNQQGAIYGWEFTPMQSGSKRLPHITPVDGLYLAGHWTQPGAASIRVFVSGIHTAQMVLGRHFPDVRPDFHHPDMPPL